MCLITQGARTAFLKLGGNSPQASKGEALLQSALFSAFLKRSSKGISKGVFSRTACQPPAGKSVPMETGVTILGHYEDEAFDRHSLAQEHATFDGGLTESVSFGRFAEDSHSWVKRSSFNHNQYLEELGSCSTPGSVRQKKAYFEAYYKAIAKRKALENALAAEGINNNHVIEEKAQDVYNEPKSVSDHGAGNACTSTCSPHSTGVLNERVSNSFIANEKTVNYSVQPSADDSPALDTAKQNSDSHDVEALLDYNESLSSCLLQTQDILSSTAPEVGECLPDIVVEDDANISIGEIQHDNLGGLDTERISSDHIAITCPDDGREITLESTDINCLNNRDDKFDVQVVDKFEMSEISRQEAHQSSPVENSSSQMVVSHNKLPKRTHIQPTLGSAKGRTNIAEKFTHKSSLGLLPPSKKAQASFKTEKKPLGSMSVTDENAKSKGKPEEQHNHSGMLRQGATTKEPKKKEVTVVVKEQRQGGMKTNGLIEPLQSERRSRPSSEKNNTFSFKCHERAEKRKEAWLFVVSRIFGVHLVAKEGSPTLHKHFICKSVLLQFVDGLIANKLSAMS
ncbi:hypothetical protein L7F22_013136 [Adiantum nelumboides]|nr:hypothetical protein [Adiantum nelumboides]